MIHPKSQDDILIQVNKFVICQYTYCIIYNYNYSIQQKFMNDLIHCTKCSSIPYDILIMNCSHNLCVKCAVERLNSQNTARSLVGRMYLQCQKCKARTSLDQQSVAQLQKAQKLKGYGQKFIINKSSDKRKQTPINNPRVKKDKQPLDLKVPSQQKIDPLTHLQEQETQNIAENQNDKTDQKHQSNSTNELLLGSCDNHQDEPVMYYCFTCKIHCFCAQCILLGKHNQHDVKVIKKAIPGIQKQFELVISVTKKNIKSLIEGIKIAANDINSAKNKIDSIKKSIGKSFDDIRGLVREKQLEFMKLADQEFAKLMEKKNGAEKKGLQTKLFEQKNLLIEVQSIFRKDEKTVLNFYSDQWTRIIQAIQIPQAKFTSPEIKFNAIIEQYVETVRKQLDKIQIKKIED